VRIYSGPCNDFAIVDTANIPGITWTHLNLSAQPTDKTTSTASPVRYRIVALLAVFSLVAYILRMNTSVAAKFMMPDLGLTEIQMGQVFSAFMLGYAIFQIPWGLLGDRSGPSRTLTIAALIWAVTTGLTGLAPGHLIPAFATLLILRFLLGAGQAALYPLAAGAVGNWMPGSERAFAYSIIIAAAAAGSAFTGPLIAWSMVALGWRMAFYLCAALALIIAGLWFWYATDRPAAQVTIAISRSSWARLLRDRNILLICASYFLSSYVLFMFIFWFYLYLVDERKFSILSGGMFTSMPYILALIVVPVGGR
jgi:MFS transporter, ACS family, glucarate transporter